ncbi:MULTISPECIES: hypothetical protein [Vitreoscilla]|uniref:Uncharacterized protein n=1 Tax=Vitreoscilla stercoraria TaxID=61 RepID=A0ABY4ECP8_VITST|nr:MULTISPECIES: hypothetical protein [Vitreoscilla]AUZ05134.2 hypothetical protein ADP71_15630 [Vitreoscilla sp. C1]UOO93517.1 hypothetical protein LVJ81_05690 [Vitreoscilla stercoraria]
MQKWLKTAAVLVLLGMGTMAWAESMTYRLDGRYPGIVSEWIEVNYSDTRPGHINQVFYWNTSEEKDSLEIVNQHYVEYDGGGAYTGSVRFPISGDQYTYAINTAGFVLSDDSGDTDPAVFEEED